MVLIGSTGRTTPLDCRDGRQFGQENRPGLRLGLGGEYQDTAANYAEPTRTPRVPNEEGSEKKGKKLVVMRARDGQL